MKRMKKHKVKKEKPDPSTSSSKDQQEHDLAYYIHDRVELMHQVFSLIKYKEIKAMAPQCVRNLPLGDLQELCTEELLGISSKRLLAILDGAEPPSDTESSSRSATPDDNLETISLDSISSDEEILNQASGKKKKKHKHRRGAAAAAEPADSRASRAGLTVLELLELQARARAIRAQLLQEQARARPSETESATAAADDDDDEVEIKEEAPDVVEISSDDDRKPSAAELAAATKQPSPKPSPAKQRDAQDNQKVTKKINDLIITVPQTKTTRKIKLNRKGASTRTDTVTKDSAVVNVEKIATIVEKKTANTEKTITNTENKEKRSEDTVNNITTVKDSNKNIKTKSIDKRKVLTDEDAKDKRKKAKRKQRLSKDKDSDHDEITLQLSDSEKMELEHLDLSKDYVTSSDSDSESSSDDEQDARQDKDVGEQNKDGTSKDEGRKDRGRKSEEGIDKNVVKGDGNEGVDRDMDRIEEIDQNKDLTNKSKDTLEIDVNITGDKLQKDVTSKDSDATNVTDVSNVLESVKDSTENGNDGICKDKNDVMTEQDNISKDTTNKDDCNSNSSLKDGNNSIVGDIINNKDENNSKDDNEVITVTCIDDIPLVNDVTEKINDSDKSREQILTENGGNCNKNTKINDNEECARENILITIVNTRNSEAVEIVDDSQDNIDKMTENSNTDNVADKTKSIVSREKGKNTDVHSAQAAITGERTAKVSKTGDKSAKNRGKRTSVSENKSDGEISDRDSSEVEAMELKPEVVCISDDDTSKSHKKKKKKDKKSKKDRKKKKSDFRLRADENFYKDTTQSFKDTINKDDTVKDCKHNNIINFEDATEHNIIINVDKEELPTKLNAKEIKENPDIEQLEISDEEVLELSDDSSCYEVEGTCISKEPTAEEIEALSAKIDEIEREGERMEVVTEEEIRRHEEMRAKIDEAQDNAKDGIDFENVSWKDRYLDSTKVKKVLTTSNILNALRKKNKILKQRIEQAKKVDIEESKNVQEKCEKVLEEGSIELYNTLESLTTYVDPVKEVDKDNVEKSEDTEKTEKATVTREMKKDAKQLLKMYKKLLKYNDINKKSDPNKKKKKKSKKKMAAPVLQ